MRLLTLFLTVAFCLHAEIWSIETSFKVQNVGAVVPSPGGQWAAWTQTKAVMTDDKSEMLTQIWVGRTDGSLRLQLTQGDKNSTNPQWSPDNKWIYFSSVRSGKGNLYRIPVDGGEADQLTDLKGNLGGFKLSPDGKTVAFTQYEPPADIEKEKKEKRDWKVLDDRPANHALYTITVDEAKRPVKKLHAGSYHVLAFVWSPDSRAIAIQHQPTPIANDWIKSDLIEVDAGSGAAKPVANTKAAETNPVYSPDGRYLAFTRSSIPIRWASEDRVVLLTRSSGELRELPWSQDQNPNLLAWTADSRNIIFSEAQRTRTGFFLMPIDGPPTTFFVPDAGVAIASNVNLTGTHIGFAHQRPDTPAEAYVIALNAKQPIRVSAANTELPKFPIGKTEVIRWKSKDGMEIEGLLTYPVGYEKGKRYPMLLNIHGGPAGVFAENFIGTPGIYPLATFAAKGYAILRGNIRGSGGYGVKFRQANTNDWGGKDYQDLMAGVDHVIAQGIADPDHLGVLGWSYGGYMTSWVVTQTNRFKAAAAGAPVTNLWSFTGTADIPDFLPDYFQGEPWEAFENYRTHSPITYVGKVATPTLILHGEADERVPPTQGFEFYNSLKRRGVATKMVTYPRMPHGPVEPKFMMDIMQRHFDWMEKYVR